MTRVLFVCTGNICRSPTAEGLARHWAHALGVADEFEFDSAGTQAYHSGEAPDLRTQAAALRRGYDLSALRARPVLDEDFERFDLILAMDKSHLLWLRQRCPADFVHKLDLFLSYAGDGFAREVSDPYYGGAAGFEVVLDQCEVAVRGLLRR